MRGRLGWMLALASLVVVFGQAPKEPAPKGTKKAPPAKKKGPAPSETALAVNQIEAFIQSKTIQDSTVAGMVEKRGVEGLSRAAVERLREMGAGPQTLAALEKLLPKGELLVRSDGEAQVTIDGKRVGVTSAQGELKIEAVEPGPHTVRVAKADFEPLEKQVEVEARKVTEVDLRLREATGYLDLIVFPADAAVAVEGSGSFQGSVKQKKLPVGPKQITVSAPYHTSAAFQITLASGQTVERTVRLVLDPSEVKRLRAKMEEVHGQKDWNNSYSHALHLLKLSPTDPVAFRIATLSRMNAKDWENYRKYGAELLRAGGELELPVTHKHGVGRNHEALMILSGLSVRYEPGPGCPLGPLAAPVDQAQITAAGNQLRVTMPAGAAKPVELEGNETGAVQAWVDLAARARKGEMLPKRDVSNLVRPPKPDAVYFWDEKGVPLELEPVTSQTRRGVVTIGGAGSKVSLPTKQPVFVTRNPQAVNLELYALKTNGAQRELRAGTAPLPVQVSAGTGVSRVDVSLALGTGEYCFGIKGSAPSYCFAVK